MDKIDFINNITDSYVKEYVSEAINSYNAGSFRACITYTWLSIFMDITQKIEQLAMLGENEAIEVAKKLDEIRKSNNITEMLSYEREILKFSKEKFYLFDDITLIDLARIQEDRNRCVHPLLSYDGILYTPTAEQARTHLQNAYSKLLKEPNVYGKAVLEKLMILIDSPAFPVNYNDTKTVLENGYLKSPRDVLLRNFIVIVLKKYIRGKNDHRKKTIYENLFKYLLETNRGNTEKTLKEKLHEIINIANTEEFINYLELVSIDLIFYEMFNDANRLLIKNHIKELPPNNLDLLDKLARIPDLRDIVLERIGKTPRSELYDIIPFAIPKTTRELIIKLYLKSENFEQANDFASVVRNAIDDCDDDDVNKLINGFDENGQVTSSFEFKTILFKLKNRKKIIEEKYNELIDKYGIK
jgi:hypothetical protein